MSEKHIAPIQKRKASSLREPQSGERTFWMRLSASMFLMGLALVTFEEVRPFGVMASDYCFLLSILFIPKRRLLQTRGSGVVFASALILIGAVLSLHEYSSLSDAATSFVRLFLLFGIIALLALAHSRNIFANLSFLAGGIFVNCLITLLQASIFPEIVDALSVNPPQPDVGFTGRYQGLTEFPVTLGLTAALAVLIGIGLFPLQKSRLVRWGLGLLILVSSIAALLSGSRTFFASLVPGVLVMVLLQKRQTRSFLYAGVAAIVLFLAVSYLVPSVVSRYSERVDTMGLVDYNRIASSAQAVLEIAQKPLLGWGIDHFDEGGVIVVPETGELAGAHNTFLRYWYAAGLLGAIGFLLLFLIPARHTWRAWKASRRSPTRGAEILPLILGSYVFFFIVSNLGPYLYNRYLYVPIFLLAGYGSMILESAEAHKVPAPRLGVRLDRTVEATS
jgi:O-antigen ligase